MPLWGRTDAYGDKPKAPQGRTQHGVIRLIANAATFPATVLGFAQGSVTANGIANGYVVGGTNVGNTIGTVGYNQIAPYVILTTSNSVTLSQAIGGNITAGQTITFSKPIFRANVNNTRKSANTYNSNTYMVTTARLKNASPSIANATTHVGWNHVTHFTGYVSSVVGTPGGKGYLPETSANQFFIITANNTFGGNAITANVGFTTNANGSISNTIVNIQGSGYVLTPTVATNGINAIALQYISSATVTLGGWLYANGTVLTISGGTGKGANVVAFVNAAGAIVSANVISNGGGWGSTAPTASVPAGGTSNATVSLVMANGANATLVTTMGGKANRIHVQTLVAMSNVISLTSGSGGLDWPGA